MIPVKLKKEPKNFDAEVRQKGWQWLDQHRIRHDTPPPEPDKLPPFWRDFNHALWRKYSGCCAYLAIYFEFATGAASTDHFVAKSRHAGDAYEWRNYRLACLAMNRLKNRYDDVLDPVGLAKDTFWLNLASGKIRPNPALDPAAQQAAHQTIARLKLNSRINQTMRRKHWAGYLKYKGEAQLKALSPFVWYEAQRQGLL